MSRELSGRSVSLPPDVRPAGTPLALPAVLGGDGRVRAACVSCWQTGAARRDRPDAADAPESSRSREHRPPATATPLNRVLEDRRGVCQDFAHVAISCLRRTRPGSALCQRVRAGRSPVRAAAADRRRRLTRVARGVLSGKQAGWNLNPTNNVIAGERHVTVAWGRDYGDVSPLRGVLLGGAGHRLYVGVSVLPVESQESAPDT